MAKNKGQIAAREYEQHPIAIALMPGGMNEEEFDALCEDVEQRGILMPATLYEGKVLDGWHRYRAHRRTGKPLIYVNYEGNDPSGYVAACNVLRRKLSSLQKALVGARIHLMHAVSQRDVCRRLSISNTVLTMVLKAIDNKCTAIIKRIENDSEYTRGLLREELEELQIVHANYGRSKAPTDGSEEEVEYTDKPLPEETDTSKIANSAFDLGRLITTPAADLNDMLGIDPIPDTGSKPSHPERRAKSTEAQNMKKRFMALEPADRKTFVQMVWDEIKPLALDLGYLGHTSPWVQPAKKRAKAK